jgi:hypothetical protein
VVARELRCHQHHCVEQQRAGETYSVACCIISVQLYVGVCVCVCVCVGGWVVWVILFS